MQQDTTPVELTSMDDKSITEYFLWESGFFQVVFYIAEIITVFPLVSPFRQAIWPPIDQQDSEGDRQTEAGSYARRPRFSHH